MKLLSLIEYENLKEKNKQEWLKYCYDVCETYNWNRKKIERISGMYGYLTETGFISNGKKYIEEYLKPVNLNSKDESLVPSINSKYNSILNKLIYTEDEEEISKLIKESSCDLETLRQNIPGFIRLYMCILTETEQKKLTINLESKIKKESEKEEEINKTSELEKIMLIENLFNPVLKNKMTEKELARQLSINVYNKYLETLKKCSPAFYKKYINKLKNDKKANEIINKELDTEIKKLYSHIVNGIETEEGIRDFDIIDYYKLYGKYNKSILEYIRNNIEKLNVQEIRVLKSFYHYNILSDEVLRKKGIEDFKETIIEFNCKEDKFGFLIPNSGIIIPIEEKENMLKYLKDNKIPVTNKTTRALINRYKENVLNKSIVKTRKPNS